MTTKTKRRAPRGASPDPKTSTRWAELQQLHEEVASLRSELATARLAVGACGVDVTAFPTLATAIRHLDQSAHDFAIAADQRTTAKERECERLRLQVRRFASMVGDEAVMACHEAPPLVPWFPPRELNFGGLDSPVCRMRPEGAAAKDRVLDSGGVGNFRVRGGVLESLHGVTIAPRDKAREVLK